MGGVTSAPPAVDTSGDADTLKDACGVFGVYAPGVAAAHLVYDGLYALQHRGQESAGMAVYDDEQVITVVKRSVTETSCKLLSSESQFVANSTGPVAGRCCMPTALS